MQQRYPKGNNKSASASASANFSSASATASGTGTTFDTAPGAVIMTSSFNNADDRLFGNMIFDCVSTSSTSSTITSFPTNPSSSSSSGSNISGHMTFDGGQGGVMPNLHTTNEMTAHHYQTHQPQPQHHQMYTTMVDFVDMNDMNVNVMCFSPNDLTTLLVPQHQQQPTNQQTMMTHHSQYNHQANNNQSYYCILSDQLTPTSQHHQNQQQYNDYTNIDNLEPSLLPGHLVDSGGIMCDSLLTTMVTAPSMMNNNNNNQSSHQQHQQQMSATANQNQSPQQQQQSTNQNPQTQQLQPPTLQPQQQHQQMTGGQQQLVNSGQQHMTSCQQQQMTGGQQHVLIGGQQQHVTSGQQHAIGYHAAANSGGGPTGGGGGHVTQQQPQPPLPYYQASYQHSSPTGSSHTSSGSTDLSEEGDEVFGYTPVYKQRSSSITEIDFCRNVNNNGNNSKSCGGNAGKRQIKKRKPKKDPNEPQKPVSAYALFFRDTQATIKGKTPNASFGEVSKIVASMWDSLDVDQKNLYKQKTEMAKKDYLKQLATYRANLLSKSGLQCGADLYSEMMGQQRKFAVTAAGIISAPTSATAPDSTTASTTILGAGVGPNDSSSRKLDPCAEFSGKSLASLIAEPAPQQVLTATTTLTVPQSYMPTRGKIDYDADQTDMSANICIRQGCSKQAINSPQWDREYCSNECVVKHCRDVFSGWVRNRQSETGTYVCSGVNQ